MSTLQGTGVLALWIDVAPELDQETDMWYVDEHLPERVDIGGYHRARRYLAIEGSPAYLTMFEADTPQALASAGYLRLVGKLSDQSHRIRAGFSNVVRNTFLVRRSAGRGLGGVIASLRLRLRAGVEPGSALGQIDAQQDVLLRAHGVVGVHWLEAAPEVRAAMDAVRLTGTHDAPTQHVLLVEATSADALRGLRGGLLDDGRLARAGFECEAWGIYGLVYEVSDGRLDVKRETALGGRS